jgi:hypothetical protein
MFNRGVMFVHNQYNKAQKNSDTENSNLELISR